MKKTFACTALVGSTKAGVLKSDEDGYYKVVLGALNIENSVGAYYPADPALELFQPGSALMRRIEDGACRAEYGHPKPTPGQTQRDFLRRVCTIEETRTCAHIKEVTLDYDNYNDDQGNKVVAILGKVKPTGPYGGALRESLENAGENVCFSIRSLTDDVYVGGKLNKNIRTIINWDYVNEPGLVVAKKWFSPSLEAHDNVVEFKREDFEYDPVPMAVGMESTMTVGMEELRESLGYQPQPENKFKTPSMEW